MSTDWLVNCSFKSGTVSLPNQILEKYFFFFLPAPLNSNYFQLQWDFLKTFFNLTGEDKQYKWLEINQWGFFHRKLVPCQIYSASSYRLAYCAFVWCSWWFTQTGALETAWIMGGLRWGATSLAPCDGKKERNMLDHVSLEQQGKEIFYQVKWLPFSIL